MPRVDADAWAAADQLPWAEAAESVWHHGQQVQLSGMRLDPDLALEPAAYCRAACKVPWFLPAHLDNEPPPKLDIVTSITDEFDWMLKRLAQD